MRHGAIVCYLARHLPINRFDQNMRRQRLCRRHRHNARLDCCARCDVARDFTHLNAKNNGEMQDQRNFERDQEPYTALGREGKLLGGIRVHTGILASRGTFRQLASADYFFRATKSINADIP